MSINTQSDTGGAVCNKDMQNTSSDLNSCQDKQWEMNPVNDVTMSDITRAVNAFITNPGSSTHGRVFPKKEPDEDLCKGLLSQSNTNNETVGTHTLGSGSAHTSTYTNDRTEENVIFCEKVTLPKGVNSTNILKCRSLQTIPFIEEVITFKDSALPTAGNASNTLVSRNLQTNIHEDEVVFCENTLPKVVEALDFFKYSKLPSNSGMVLGGWRSGRNDVGSTSTSKQLGSTIIATKPVLTQKHFFCPTNECNLKFSSKRKIDKHVNTHHKSEGFPCSKCGKRFGRISYLEQHDNVHKGIKPYTCKICGKKFHTHMTMYEHSKAKHFEPKNKLQCEICGVVGNGSFMSKHTRRVHLKQRYPCTECKQDFRILRYLKDHMRVHRGEEAYKCDLCAKTFVQKNNLLQHLKRHSRELQCPKCDKVFKSKDYLKGHLLQHEGIKKFCCDVCGKTFHHAHYLFTHKKSHGEKDFDCAICGGKFNRKDNLKSHIIRHQTTGRINLKKK